MKRQKRYVRKLSGGMTDKLFYELTILQKQLGVSKAQLLREAVTLLLDHYRKLGYNVKS